MTTASIALPEQQLSQAVQVDTVAIVGLSTFGAIVGLAPAALFLNAPALLVYFGPANALIAYLTLRDFRTSATEAPTTAEFALAGLNTIFAPIVMAAFWLAFHGLVFWSLTLIQAVCSWAGLPIQIDAQAGALYSGAVIFGLWGLAFFNINVRRIAQRLYPNAAGLRSDYYEVLSQGTRALVGIILYSVGLLVVGILAGFDNFLVRVFIIYAILIVASLETTFEDKTRTPAGGKGALDAVHKLFAAKGYEILLAPRTGQAAIDPLLVDLDLFARRGDSAFVIEVKGPTTEAKALDWTVGANLRTAALSLAPFTEPLGVDPHKLEALLILVESKAPAGLQSFATREALRIVELPSAAVEKINAATEREQLESLWHEYFDLANGRAAGSVPAREPDAGQGKT